MTRHMFVAASDGTIVSLGWWRVALDRATRQALQTAVPVLAVVAGTGQVEQHALLASLIIVATSAAVSLLKSMVDLKASTSAPLWVRYLERAVTAFAGTLAGYLTSANLVTLDWSHSSVAALGAALVAVVTFYLTPPVDDSLAPVTAGEPADPVVDPTPTLADGVDGSGVVVDPPSDGGR